MVMNQEHKIVCTQSERILHAKLEILDTNLNIIRELTGKLLDDGSYTITAKTGMRRSCNISLLVDRETIPHPSSPIWINKKIRLYIGIVNIRTDEPVWFPIGTFAISEPTRDIQTNGKDVLRIKGVDFVAFLDGTLGGSLGKNVKILHGNRIDKTIRDTMNEFTNFNTSISTSAFNVPYEFEKKAEDNIWNIVSELIDLYMNYEGYFDEYGTFIFRKASTLIDDSIVWDFSVPENNLIIDANIEYAWNDVRNKITVTGKEKDGVVPTYTCVALSSMKGWEDCPFTIDKLGEVTAFDYRVPDNYVDKIWEKLQSETSTETVLGKLKKYIEDKKWDKVDGIQNTVGAEVRQFLLGQIDEATLEQKMKSYDMLELFTDVLTSSETRKMRYNPRSIVINEPKYFKVEQCITRAQYELDKRLACAEKVKLTIVPIYGLDVNQLIYLDFTTKNGDTLKGKFCIDNISCRLGKSGKMDITCHKVTKNRFGFDQTLLHKKDESWMYTGEIVEIIDFDGSVRYLTENTDVFGRKIAPINSLFPKEIVYKYRLSLLDQYKLKDIFDFVKTDTFYSVKDGSLVVYIPKESKAYELKRDKYRNWYTDGFLYGQDLIINKGWKNNKPDGLENVPLFFDKFNFEFRVYPNYTTHCEHYLPYWVVENYKFNFTEAKAFGLVALAGQERTNVPFKFGFTSRGDWNSLEMYMCFWMNGGKINTYIVDGFDENKAPYGKDKGYRGHILREIKRNNSGVWYADGNVGRSPTTATLNKRVYGDNLYKTGKFTGDWVGYEKIEIDELVKKGYVRVDYDAIMNGTIQFSESGNRINS